MVVKNWASILDPNALEQAERSSRVPIVSGHVALMPDAHWGMGATIGSVIPTKGGVIPAAVGVDLGCGMIAVHTSLRAGDLPDSLDPLHDQISRSVKAGIGKRGSWAGNPRPAALEWMSHHTFPSGYTTTKHGESHTKIAVEQLGTLGSGNHFIEVCLDETSEVWVVIHSGSRGVGNKLAQEHIKVAKRLCTVPLEDPDLAFLQESDPEFGAYIADMFWCQAYARANRNQMMDAVLGQLFRIASGTELVRINCHHNFTQLERHFGQTLWVTRKGAIQADLNRLGVVPGSMGTQSFITRGLGNPDSYHSSAHGAGRQRSRNAARRELSVDDLRERMKGKTWNSDQAEALLDEHPEAYKPIDQVMADQADLCEPIHTLRQILNFKGA